jgi:tetratricopeptide (TPR) repeat protein
MIIRPYNGFRCSHCGGRTPATPPDIIKIRITAGPFVKVFGYTLLVFLLFFEVCFGINGQELSTQIPESALSDSAFMLGQRLEKAEDYDEAITEYKRFFFFNLSEEDRSCALFMIGNCFARLGKWKEAVDTLVQSLRYCPEGEARDQRNLAVAQVEIASADYNPASLTLLELARFSNSGSIRKQAVFFLGIVSLYRYEWEKARDYLRSGLDETKPLDAKKLREIDSILSPEAEAGLKSPAAALVLSGIIPGLGQAYAGNPLDGLVSFGLNASSGVWVGFLFAGGDWVDGLVAADLLFLRFYLGNLSNTERLVREYNEKMNNDIARKIVSVLTEGNGE